ncbi:ras association domain-containing protein 10 isoform X1 [Drosophila navojoa]|uniref:ras association domain-containing protein 10 isoform X1 n=1 Tax=Drosophila navojoa TaxID=7232 RepID=UPI00084665C4|nr:ras association domain-containing protein 10 isoform X1 [Drosophila navojoa]
MLKQESGLLKKASVTVVAPNTNYAHFFKPNERISCNADIDPSPDVRSAGDSLIDPISVTIDGEKHWVSGVDANTTCTDLICALLSYKDLEGKDNEHLPIYNTLSNESGRSIHTSSQNTNHKATTITNTKENKQTSYSKGLNTNLHQYVIVKRLRDSRFEEYLDGSTRLIDVIPIADKLTKNQCELQLRNLASDTSARFCNQVENQMFSMLSMSTDKDSGMGSPVGSARSERYRRRRGKAHRMGVTEGPALPKHTKILQPQPCNLNPNEHLMNIILAQDETIKRQIYLLNQKEQQILKIEDEKHRARAQKLGKNYLIDTYLNALGKAPDKELDRPDLEDQWECVTTSHKLNSPHPACIHEVDANQPAEIVSNISLDANIYWLEKVYTLNVRLQREEEELLRLHAKVRKHQMRLAYHTKDEVLQQIDRLDTNLANQVNDIYRIERQLLVANEQLKAKLGVLESLGNELEVMPAADQEMSAETTALTLQLNDDLIAHRKSIAEHLIQNLQEKEARQNYVKNLIKNNANGRDQTDAKMLKKQLFFAVDKPETLHQEEQPQTRYTSNNESNRLLGFFDPDIDIENFGTLV